MEVDERSDQKSDIYRHWMAAHACLKNEFTEDEKYHNLMTWFICCLKCFKTRYSLPALLTKKELFPHIIDMLAVEMGVR